jgi:tetratricopeptide (TPR) repeat protein
LLSQRHDHDRSDPFATDSDDDIRRLGRLALRRPVFDAADSFALGDLCAKRSLREDQLLITYVGKALIAYRRAGKQSARQAERDLAAQAVERFISWVLDVTALLPSPRNIAVALWAAADLPPHEQPEGMRRAAVTLAGQYATSAPQRNADRETIDAPAVNLRGATPATSSNDGQDSQHTMSVPLVDPVASVLNDYDGPRPPDEDDLTNSLLVRLKEHHDVEARPGGGLDPDELPDGDDGRDDLPRDLWPTHPPAGDPFVPGSPVFAAADDPTSITPSSAAPASLSLPNAARYYTPDAPPPSHHPPPANHPPVVVSVRMVEEGNTGDYQAGEWLFDRDPQIKANRYEIRRILKGGMGIIYICRDARTAQVAAIKTFQGRFLSNERAAARFEQEALAWMRLEKHPNIVQARKVQRFGDERVAERPHIILEYVPPAENLSADLKSWIEAGALTIESALTIALDICRGMIHATSKIPSLVHRDLKPGNVLVRYDGLAKVTDFGLVRTLDTRDQAGVDDGGDADPERLTRAGAIVGTAAYMSPEQTFSRDVDVRADIYAFGAILWEMLTRQQVFKARTFDDWLHAHRYEIPRFPESLPARVPIPLRRLLMDCLDKQPESRPQTWQAVRDELTTIYQSLTDTPPPDADDADSEMALDELMDKAYGLSELGYREEAVATYERALELAPPSRHAWVWGRKANALRVGGDALGSLAAFDRAFSLDPAQAWLWHSRGLLLERTGQKLEALESYQKASSLRPKDVRYLMSLARLQSAEGYHADALRDINSLLALAPNDLAAHRERAHILSRLGQHEDALTAFNHVLELRPTDGWAWYGKGKALRKLGRLQEALTAAREATDRLPTAKWAWLLYADLNAQLSRYEDALEAIRHVTIIAPELPEAWLREGKYLSALNRPNDALTALDRALDLRPDDSSALSSKSRLLQSLQRHEEAISALDRSLRSAGDAPVDVAPLLRRKLDSLLALNRHFEAALVVEKLLALDPANGAYWGLLGKVRRQLKQGDQAEAAYRRAVELLPTSAPLWNKFGLLLRRQNHDAEALAAFERAIALDAVRAWYWFNKASALFDLGRYLDCLEALGEAQDRDDRLPDMWIKRGQALRKLGRFKESLSALDEATELAPQNAWAWNHRGLTLAEMRRFDESLTSYERALQIAPDNVWWFYLNKAEALVNLGQRDDALTAVERAVQIAPGSTIPLLRKGAILRQLERHDEALAVYDQALALNPKEFGAWYGKARAYGALDQMAAALAAFQQLSDHHPSNPSVWVWYGEALLEANQPREALRVLQRALLIDPNHAIAQRRRDEAKRRLDKE